MPMFLFSQKATWYNLTGNKTASGEIFRTNAMTCASNKYKLGTILRITYNERVIVVRVNDRGRMPLNVIDLSRGAFLKLAPLNKGVINIKVEVLKK